MRKLHSFGHVTVLIAIVISTVTFAAPAQVAEASMINDVKDKITRWVTQEDAVDRCNEVYPGANYESAAPVIPSTVSVSSLSIVAFMCGGSAPLLAEDVNDAYCGVGSDVAARLDPIFEPRWWKLGRRFVGWACVKA